MACLLLTGWIIVEVVVIGQFSPLQVAFGLAGLVLMRLGLKSRAERTAYAEGQIPSLAVLAD